MEKLNTCKNMDKYENMVKYFHIWLVLLVCDFYYDEYKTVFYLTILGFYYSIDKNKNIALNVLLKNTYN